MSKRQFVTSAIALFVVCSVASAEDSNQLPNGDFSNASQISGWSTQEWPAISFSMDGAGNSSAFFDDLHFTSTPPAPPPIRLGGYLSGNWYDPTHSGQGFQLEFTDQNNTLLAIWFTFAPDGSGQRWIYAQAPYDTTADAVTLPAEILNGGRFPPLFNSSDLHATLWGEMTFVFSDCNHGTAIWNSSVPGYGSGSMPISRLTSIRGTTCPQ